MTESRHHPLRTCVGCREVKPKVTLVRLVRDASGAVRVDATGTSAGRGAYICSDAGCIERVIRGGRLGHAFRRPTQTGKEFETAVRAAAGAGPAQPAGRRGERAGRDTADVVRAAGRATAKARGA